MASVNLDDPSESVFVIPYNEEEEDPFDDKLETDAQDGSEVRWEAYTKAWSKCLDRIQSIVHKLHGPVVKAVSLQVDEAYSQSLPGLPHPELPVITVSNPSGGNIFLDELNKSLEPSDNEDEPSTFTNHLEPSQCPNITMAMRALITGFTKCPPDKKKYPRAINSSTLASYDIGLLDAWYQAVREARDARNEPLPRLVVILHDFERFDPSVMQDVFYICSLHVPKIPLVFVVSLLSPQSPTYLHVTYPRWTLSVLRIQQFTAPSGLHLLEEIILGTFFDASFNPNLMLGHSVLTFIIDYFERYDSSVESLIHLIRLAHMKHFNSDPFTFLIHPIQDVHSTMSHTQLDLLWERVCSSDDTSKWTVDRLQKAVDGARSTFEELLHRKRTAYGVMKVVYTFFVGKGFKRSGLSPLKLALNMLSRKNAKDVSELSAQIAKLKFADVPRFFNAVETYLNEIGEDTATLVELEPSDEGDMRQAANDLADWFETFMGDALEPLEDSTMWYIWYTGKMPFPVELVNPSVRSSVIGGLLRPREFTVDGEVAEEPEGTSITDVPDTSVLFQRYLESGKMINVYDWYEAFKGVLDMQRMELAGKSKMKGKAKASPQKGKGKGKGKEKALDPKDEEKWQLECQARFIRALHELDYMGFVKHTGRKADHVLRTVFEIGDDE